MIFFRSQRLPALAATAAQRRRSDQRHLNSPQIRYAIGDEHVWTPKAPSIALRLDTPELTPFLDALMAVDAPGGDLWAGYDLQVGRPLFSFDGETCVHRDWISDVWHEHIGTGAHIVRSLWHEIVGAGDDDRLWVALALCGQKDRRTAREYRMKQANEAAVRKGRGLLAARRQRARNADR